MSNGEDDNLLVKKIVVDYKYEVYNFTPVLVKYKSTYWGSFHIIPPTTYDEDLRIRWSPGTVHTVVIFVNIYGEDYIIVTNAPSIDYYRRK